MKTVKWKVKKTAPEIHYSGHVKTGIVKDNNLYSVKYFKNTGRWPLFTFFAECLTGDYTQADPYRPKFIRVFSAGEDGNPLPVIQNITDFRSVFNEQAEITTFPYPYMSQPRPEVTESSGNDYIGACDLTYKFMIPFTQLRSLSDVNLIALYCGEYRTDCSEPSAYLFITDGEGKLSDLIPPELQNTQAANQYNLYIEWTLGIGNTSSEE